MVKMTAMPIGPLIVGELEELAYDSDRISIDQEIPSDLHPVETVEYQLRQVLGDLLDNAVAAVADRPRGHLRVVARDNTASRRVELEISDNGEGITDDMRDQIFTPGVSTKAGTLGIGLWYGRSFMQATGGDIVLSRTAPGEGTTFLIEIPFARVAAPQKVIIPRLQNDILVVENEPDWRASLTDSIANENYSIKIAADYATACDILAQTYFKLAILDLSLNGDPQNRDGLKLLEHIDELNLDTRVIIVTGHGDEEDRRVARRSPRFEQMIDKGGFSVSNFRKLVHQSLRGPASSGTGTSR
jgi:CheY-like chemotaxis protein